MKNSLVVLALCTAAAAATASAAPPPSGTPSSPPRFRLIGNALFLPQSLEYDDETEITLYEESGTIATRYGAQSAVALDLELQFNFSRSVGLVAAFEIGSRNQDGEIEGRLPHPLYLNRPRTFSTRAADLDFKQTAGHLGLALCGGSRSLEYAVFVGPSFYQVEADLVRDFAPQEVYPYDSVTGTFTTTTSSKSGVGFHAGGRLDAWLGGAFGLGAQVRYGSAKVKLDASGGTTEVTAGGLEVGGGIRLRF